jgi:drug/metabolite transporter (DMT)-like permease
MTRPSRVKIVLAFAAVYVLWGSTYLAIRLAIETLPPFLMTGTRFTLAGLILFTWSVINGERFIPPLHLWRRALVIGGLLLLGGNGGVVWAERYVATGLAALLVSTEPLWVVILNWAISRQRPNWKVLLGVLIGLVGVAMLDCRRCGAGGSVLVGVRIGLLESTTVSGIDIDGSGNADDVRWLFAFAAGGGDGRPLALESR